LEADDLDATSGFIGTNTTGEIRIHSNGWFLYTTNHGHNSVTMFEIEPQAGELRVIGWKSTHGGDGCEG